LFLIPADSNDIRAEFKILLNELEQYNPELLDKKRVLAISKSDMLDDELKKAIKKELPKGVESVFISSITNQGITELKDLVWKNLH
jgi:GTP-binding protein